MENQKPFVSVVMPVYNAENYLEDTIKSITNQTFGDFELILVNDCSTDESAKICDFWCTQDKRIKVLHLEENGGAGNARNLGIDTAVGEYLTFVDSDDFIEKTLYEEAVSSLKETNADVCVWGVKEEYCRKEEVLWENILTLPEQKCTNKEATQKMIIMLEAKTLFGYQWNKMYRLEIIKKHSIYFEKVHLYEDYFFNISFIQYAETMDILGNAGYHYKKRNNQSLTKQYVKDYFELSRRRVETMLNLYQNWNYLDTEVINFLGNTYLRYILSALERNCTVEAKMSNSEKINWAQMLYKDNVYNGVARKCIVENKILKILQKAINGEKWYLCVAMGKGIHVVKKYFPNVFSQKVKYK